MPRAVGLGLGRFVHGKLRLLGPGWIAWFVVGEVTGRVLPVRTRGGPLRGFHELLTREDVRMFIDEEDDASRGRAEARLFVPAGLVKNLPALVEYLTLEVFPSGKPRKTSTVSWFVADGEHRVALNDRQNERCAFAVGETLEKALVALDGRLQCGEVEWKRWSVPAKKRK